MTTKSSKEKHGVVLNWEKFGLNIKANLDNGNAVFCRRFLPNAWQPVFLPESLIPEILHDELSPLPICQAICEMFVREHQKDFEPIDSISAIGWRESKVPFDVLEEIGFDPNKKQEEITRGEFEDYAVLCLNQPAPGPLVDALSELELYTMPDILTYQQADYLLEAAPLFFGHEDLWPYWEH